MYAMNESNLVDALMNQFFDALGRVEIAIHPVLQLSQLRDLEIRESHSASQ
jgi:hypothetical protein